MLDLPTAADVPEHGHWLIEDPKPRHDANPSAFWLPDDQLLATVGPGSQVRLLLWFLDEADSGEAGLSVSGCGHWSRPATAAASAAA